MTGSRASAFIVLAAVGVLLTTAGVAKQAEPGALLRAAIEKEDVTGDLQGAMALYRQVIAANGKDRAAAAWRVPREARRGSGARGARGLRAGSA
jgi:hypothetical protein